MIPTLPPVGGGDLLAAGGLAQLGRPEAWTLHEGADDVFVVRGEPGPAGDGDRARRLAGGAALLTMRLVVRLRGRRLHVHLLPDAHDPWTFAHLRVGSALAPTGAERTLGAALHPDRRPPGSERVPPAPPSARTELRRAAEAERGWLVWLEDDDPHGSLVLGTVDDDPLAHLRAGQAVQRVLLTAAVHGLLGVVETRPLATPDARAALRIRLGGGLWPQAVLRVGAHAAPDPR